MDRAKFLAGLKGSAVKLSPFTLPGFSEPVYLKPLTMADIKAELTKPDEPKEVRERIQKDQFYIERSIARLVRDEKGALLFDEKDDAQMSELRGVLDANAHTVSSLIHAAHDKLNGADKSEVDPKGN